MNHTVPISGALYAQEYKKSIKEICHTLGEIVDKTSIFSNKDNKVYYLNGLSDKIQCLDFESKLSKIIVDCLVAQSIEVFKFAPFFNDFSIWHTLSLIKKKEDLLKTESEIIEAIQQNTEMATRKDILKFISDASNHDITNIIIEESFNSIGLAGKVFVENSKSDRTTIEIKDAYSFDIETFDDFFFEKSIWTHSLVSIIVIDGIVESVSEINNILEYASKNVEPMIVVARGFGDEVLQTLYVNMQRKTLNVFPVKLLNDESSINSFVDISVVSKTDPVSYLKGNLISAINVNELSVIEKAEIRTGKMTLINREAAGSVYRHLDRLRKDANRKKEELDVMGVDALNNIMTGRMKSLSGRSIQLSLSKDITSKDTHDIKIEIDSAFRTIPYARDFGMVEVSGLIKSLKKNRNINYEKISTIENFFGRFKKIPSGCLLRCIKACHNNANLLNKTSGALLYEESQK
tara:strand:- start:284 stop:1672 length:1389 start_codon:yes stop_codon:yes gene_type:complete